MVNLHLGKDVLEGILYYAWFIVGFIWLVRMIFGKRYNYIPLNEHHKRQELTNYDQHNAYREIYKDLNNKGYE